MATPKSLTGTAGGAAGGVASGPGQSATGARLPQAVNPTPVWPASRTGYYRDHPEFVLACARGELGEVALQDAHLRHIAQALACGRDHALVAVHRHYARSSLRIPVPQPTSSALRRRGGRLRRIQPCKWSLWFQGCRLLNVASAPLIGPGRFLMSMPVKPASLTAPSGGFWGRGPASPPEGPT